MKKNTKFASANDIRPDSVTNTEKIQEAFDKDFQWILDRKSLLIPVCCPVCEGENSKATIEKFPIEYELCATCDTLYQKMRFPEELLGEYYANSAIMEYFGKYIFPASEENRREKIYRPRVDRLLEISSRYGAKYGLCVEVGAGSGVFLHEMNQRKVFDRIVAIEPARSLAESCRNFGLETFEMPVEKMSRMDADVVVSFEVIEHLFSPEKFLQDMYNILSENGMCFLTTPNSKSFEVRELGSRSTTLGFTHLNLFTPESLSFLATRVGFEVLEVTTPGILDVDLVKRGYNEKATLQRSPFIQYLVEEASQEQKDNFQQFLMENNLSSHMWIALRKI